MKTFAALALSLIFASIALASSPELIAEGTLAASWDGTPLVFRNGFWVHGGQLFTRSVITSPGHYVNGCYVAGSSYWQYYYYVPPVTVLQPPPFTINPNNPDWRREGIEWLREKDKYAQKLQLDALNHNQYMEFVREVKPTGYPSYNLGGLGYSQLGYTFSGSTTNFGVNGSSQYGYSFKDLAAIYGDNSLTQLAQAVAQNGQQAGSIYDKMLAGTLDLTAVTSAGNAKIAEKIVNGQVLVEIAKTLNAQPQIASNYSFKIGPSNTMQVDNSKVPDDQKKSNQQKWGDLAAARCAACHTEGKISGGFDLNHYLGMSNAEKQRVWLRLNDADPNKRMPLKLNPDGSAGRPGVALSDSEKALFYIN